MPTYKLYYFEGRGRAEVTRWLFALAGLEYEDIRLDKEKWLEFKPKSPFGQMPILDIDGDMISQSNAIARFIAKRTGYAGKTELEEAHANMIVDCVEDMIKPVAAMYYAADEATKAKLKKKFEEEQKDTFLGYFEQFLEKNKAQNDSDYLVGKSLTWADVALVNALTWIEGVDYEKYKLLNGLNNTVNNEPAIAKWIDERPKTKQ